MSDSGNNQDGLQDYMDLLLGPADDQPEVHSTPSKMSALSTQLDESLALQRQAEAKAKPLHDTREYDVPDIQRDAQKQQLEQALVRERVQKLALRTQQVRQQAKAERLKQEKQQEQAQTQAQAQTKIDSKPALSKEKAESLAKARAKVREKIRQRQEQKLAASKLKAKQAIAQKADAPSPQTLSAQASPAQTSTPKTASATLTSKQQKQIVDAQQLVEQLSQAQADTAQALTDERPAWARTEFDCLFFKVSGLTLAVPLVELGSIYPLSDELTPMFAQTDWFIGLLPVDGQNLKTVNTAKIVIPERYNEQWLEQVRYVISIHGYDWGLAVDNVEQAVTIDPDKVKWRSSRSKRPWLAGTIVDHMCALVDLHSLANVLDHPEQMRH